MLHGFCVPPVCFQHEFNFAAAGDIIIKPKDVPNWGKGVKVPLGTFQALEGALTAALNAGGSLFCDNDCVCLRLNKDGITVALPPMRMGPVPVGAKDVYMEGVTVTTWWGMCVPKKGTRVKKGDKWIPVEELPASDILTPPSSPAPGGGDKQKNGKKGKKGKKVRKGRKGKLTRAR